MSKNTSESDSLMDINNNPYGLLKSYMKNAKIKSKAYSYSEKYYRNLYKYLSYPLVVITATNTVLSGFSLNPYILMGLSFSSLVLIGFDKLINPKDKEHKANQIQSEFGEINRNIKQFVSENNKSRDEIKSYSQTINEVINIWESLSPPIQDKFITKAQNDYAKKIRKHHHMNSQHNIDIKT